MEAGLIKSIIASLERECDPDRRRFLANALKICLKQVHFNDQIEGMVEDIVRMAAQQGITLRPKD